MTANLLEAQKLQHPIKIRVLQVKRISELSPSMRRITLSGDDLTGFLSASFDDHVKLMVPDAVGEKPNVPTLGASGLIFDDSRPRPAMRDYTPRRYDPATNELDIDFVLHHAGPATDWATHTQPGHYVGIAGPRGSFVVPTAFDWHLLIGDETAIPAISRRLEELPSTTKAIVVVQTATDGARQVLTSQCELEQHWVREQAPQSSGMSALEAAVRTLTLPEGEGYAWAAGEYNDIKAIREYLAEGLGIGKKRIRAASYWRKSASATHERFD